MGERGPPVGAIILDGVEIRGSLPASDGMAVQGGFFLRGSSVGLGSASGANATTHAVGAFKRWACGAAAKSRLKHRTQRVVSEGGWGLGDRWTTWRRYRLLVTMTWVRRDHRWLCLAGHAGPPVQ